MIMNKIVREDIEAIINDALPFQKLYGRTVLISGANGYVPAYFVHTFLMLNDTQNAGIKVVALCRNEKRARDRFAVYDGRPDFRLLIQDVCEPIMIEDDIHVYIHAASPVGIKKRYEDPVNTFLANVKGCENMLKLAAHNPCEYFLLLSSVDVYGKTENSERLREDTAGYLDPLNVRNVYSCGKRAAESLCAAYRAKYGLPVFVARPFQIVGPGPALDDGRLHIDFIAQMLAKDEIVLKSDGTAMRTFMYIADAIRAMFTVMLKGIPGEAYNIVTETGEASVSELAKIMASRVRDRQIKIVFDIAQRSSPEVVNALSVVLGDSAKLTSLGFWPRYSLNRGTARMMQYYGIQTREEQE